MKITIFINFATGILKTPIAITLDDSDTLDRLHDIRINEYKTEYKTPYNRVYDSLDIIQYQHKDRVFNPPDFQTSLSELGLRDNDSLNINISNITIGIMRAALTADLLATNVNDPQSYSTPLSLALLVQRQLSNTPWTREDIQLLKENINLTYATWLPNPLVAHAYNQLAPLYSALDYWGLMSFDIIQKNIKNSTLDTTIYLTLIEKSSLSYLVPRTLQNTIEEKNNVLLKFSHTRNDQLLLFRNALRFFLNKKEFKNSEVNVGDNIIRITNINLAQLVAINAIPILPDAVKQALLTDLEEAKPTLSDPISSSLKLIAKRQQSKTPWTKKEILTLQNDLAAISGDRPGDYPQLLSQYATLNLLRSQMVTQKINFNTNYKQMLELANKFNESKVDFVKINEILSENTCITFNDTNNLTSSSLVQLAEVLQNHKTITNFELFKAPAFIDKVTAIALANTLQCNTTLETFTLYRVNIEDGGINILINSLKNNKTLLNLHIYSIALTEEETEALEDLLRTSTTLRYVTFNLSSDQGMNEYKELIKAANDSTSLENFTLNDVNIFRNKVSFQLTHRRNYTSNCILSLLHNDFKNFTNVTKRSGHLDFQPVDLDSLGQIIIELHLCAGVLVSLIKDYLIGDIVLAPLPMIKEIFAKKPSLAELKKDIVLNIKEDKSNNDNVVITFNEGTSIHRKLLLRNALMELFRENQMNKAAADISISTGLLTINNVTLQDLEKLNILPQRHNNRILLGKSFVA